MATEPTRTRTRPVRAAVVTETSEGVTHIVNVLRRWWALLAVGTTAALAIAGLVIVSSPTRYTATTQVAINQPGFIAGPFEGQASIEKMANLMPTFGEIARSDVVLEGVRRSARLDRSIRDLRGRTDVEVLRQTLVLRITMTLPARREAADASQALVDQLGDRVAELRGPDTPDAARFAVIPLQAPVVDAVRVDPLRIMLVALLIGFAFSAIAAFTLERT